MHVCQDVLCGSGPPERFGRGIALGDRCGTRSHELRETAKAPATNLFGRQVSTDAFEQVEPRTTGRGERPLDARVPRQPPLDRGGCRRRVRVGEPRQGLALGDRMINQTTEPQPFLRPRARQAGGEEGALRDMQGGKERGGAWRVYSCVRVPQRPGVSGKPGGVRSRAWIWLFSSTPRTTACSGGCRYRPSTSSRVSWTCGSRLR